ncbi:CU044_5270 family protein [Actinomadura gamaensis]|uniref:CU044_5270 family protein n=1 Tax=Actinomadura gamaensis TaxID=1763541 RepID=A0ABV9UAZ8_9ACTN
MSRDAMRMLAEARPDELNPGLPVEAGTRERELARARLGTPADTQAHDQAGTRRRAFRPVWGLGLAGIAAAAVAAAVLVAPGGHDAPAKTPGSGAPQALDGRTILLTAAESADRQPGGAGAFWHVTRLTREYVRVGDAADPYTVIAESRSENWTPNAPTGAQIARSQDLGARPATPADKVAWSKAGSPTSWVQKIPASKGGAYKPRPLSASPGKPSTSRTPLRRGEIFWLGRNVTMKDLRGLPADPKALKKALLRWYEGHGTEADGQKSTADEWLFDVARGLLTDMPVTPKVRAATFRLLAGLPSVASLGRVTDAQGRPGVAIGLTRPTPAGDVLQTRLIVDASAGRALGEAEVLVKRSDRFPGVPAGSVLNSATVTAEWTATSPS